MLSGDDIQQIIVDQDTVEPAIDQQVATAPATHEAVTREPEEPIMLTFFLGQEEGCL